MESVKDILTRSSELKAKLARDEAFCRKVELARDSLLQCIRAGGTLYSCGNGGSACDAMHFTEEWVARFKRERPGIRAMHFMDPSVLSCWANDYDYVSAFERQAKTFCRKGDVLLGISTSGRSENVLRAVNAAKENGAYTIAFTGKDGGTLKDVADLSIIVPATETERIQEVHITLVHILLEQVEVTMLS